MKIVGGKYRGRNLLSPAKRGIRPTSNMVKEAIFDVIGGAVTGAETLDLYAGTGALGIEALSRGAKSALFVDSAPDACGLIRSNLKKLGLGSAATVMQAQCESAVKKLHGGGNAFDIIFIDPPYHESELHGILALLGAMG
ncbi:MAG: 16S rRNA (guanine(966)-N(2))-methyltransferase RsmD, partial [Deltaproteobacteria bacterium]|nr:16S rRNA (guanine(966)-N(2))-methyltransferase RsmD [Deltaproteobacteria bacterium]